MHVNHLGRHTSRLLRPVIGCALVCLCAGPAVAQRTGETLDAPKPFAAFSASAQLMRDSLVTLARAQVGTRYLSGGQTPDRGFDCSGLVRYLMAAMEVRVPRTARQQATTGLSVGRDTARLRPGDLLTFGKTRRGVSHVGIYVGGGKYVHASSVAGAVIESDIGRPTSTLSRAWQGVRRVIGELDS